MKHRGKPPITKEEFHKSWGQGPDDDQRIFFPEWNVQGLMDFYESDFDKHVQHVCKMPDARSTLENLKQLGKQIAVASNSPSFVVAGLLTEAGLFDLVDIFIGVNEVNEGKPAPDMIYEACKRLVVPLQEACYIGDSMFDDRAARSAGIFFVGFKREGDLQIESLTELLTAEPESKK